MNQADGNVCDCSRVTGFAEVAIRFEGEVFTATKPTDEGGLSRVLLPLLEIANAEKILVVNPQLLKAGASDVCQPDLHFSRGR